MKETKDRVHHVALPVHDIETAIRWYTDRFECEVAYHDATWALISFDNISIALVTPGEHPPHIAIERNDAESFGSLTPHRDGSRSVYLDDPAGNAVEVINMQDAHSTLEVFIDRGCPLCRREVDFIQRRPASERIEFIDISAVDFDASTLDKTQAELMAQIHGRVGDTWISGPEVFRRIYDILGYRRSVRFTRLPLIRQLVGAAYAVFAFARPYLPGRHTPDPKTKAAPVEALDDVSAARPEPLD